jgi:hypothetical protein
MSYLPPICRINSFKNCMHISCPHRRSPVWTTHSVRRTVVSTDSYWSLLPTIASASTGNGALSSTALPPSNTHRMYANQIQILNDGTRNSSCRLCNTGVFSRLSSLKHFSCPVGVPRPKLIYPQISSQCQRQSNASKASVHAIDATVTRAKDRRVCGIRGSSRTRRAR